MCLLAIFFRAVDDFPLIVGANREEAYARGGEPPQVLPGVRRAIGGRDPAAGGTWLGVNDSGLFIAVTNRPRSGKVNGTRSRGLLARDLLDCSTAAAASSLATRELDQNRYAGCNVVCADTDSVIVIQAGDWLRVRPLPAGLHVLTAGDVNDATDRRTGHALGWLQQQPYEHGADCIKALKELCAQTDAPPICLHGKKGGTVSSSIVALRRPLGKSLFWHAQGSPDKTPYEDCSALLREIATR